MPAWFYRTDHAAQGTDSKADYRCFHPRAVPQVDPGGGVILHTFTVYVDNPARPVIRFCPSTRGRLSFCRSPDRIAAKEGRDAMSFSLLFSKVDEPYDIVLIDVAPSITLMQTCAMVYAQRVLIPVSMDTLSLQGAGACLETARMMNELFRVNVRPAALLPVMVDRRFQHTAVMMKSLEDLSAKFKIPLLPAIRTDVTVAKCGRARQFLVDYDPKCKAMEDYEIAGAQLLELLDERAEQRESESVQTVQA